MQKVIAIAVAALTCASACSKSKDKDSAPAGGSAAAVTCPDAEIHKRLDAAVVSSKAYFEKLDKVEWKPDCEEARQQFLALEPDADKFMTEMVAFKSFGEELAPSCRQRITELGEKSSAATELDKLIPGLQHKIEPILEQCKGKPGFDEAVAKGLRVFKKKKAAP